MAALFEALPADLNETIASALSEKLSLSQLSFLRLVNKTWRSAVEGGQFGPLGRLLRPGLPKVALLFRNDAHEQTGCQHESQQLANALPAMGVVDEATCRIHIFPLGMSGAPFDPKRTRAVLLGRSIFSFTNLSLKLIKRSGLTEVRTTGMSSFNLVSRLPKAYRPFICQKLEETSLIDYFHVNNTTPLDEHRFLVYGHHYERSPISWCQSRDRQHIRKVRPLYLVLVFDSKSATWAFLPPLPFSAQRVPYDPRSFCYVSQGRIWVSHKLNLYSITSRAGTKRKWKQESVSIPFRSLEAPPPSFEVLSALRELQGSVRWQIAIQTQNQPRVLDLPAPKKGYANQTARGALAVSGGLLVLSPDGAYLDGLEMTYVWEQGAGAELSPQKCRVLWAAGFDLELACKERIG